MTFLYSNNWVFFRSTTSVRSQRPTRRLCDKYLEAARSLALARRNLQLDCDVGRRCAVTHPTSFDPRCPTTANVVGAAGRRPTKCVRLPMKRTADDRRSVSGFFRSARVSGTQSAAIRCQFRGRPTGRRLNETGCDFRRSYLTTPRRDR